MGYIVIPFRKSSIPIPLGSQNWILQTGFWDDAANWRDTASWTDGPGPPLTLTTINNGDAGVNIRTLLNDMIALLS